LTTLLSDIANRIKPAGISGDTDIHISGVAIDSRKVKPGFLYAALPGTAADGHQFIDQAIENGAVAIICRSVQSPKENIAYLFCNDVPEATGLACDVFYDSPSSKMVVVGTTGTNGKTTVSTLLFEMFTSMGHKCGLISTVENKIGDKIIPSTHTTPDAAGLHALMAKMVAAGVTHCFMECSSHAIHQRRIAGVEFDGAIFTNITHDHLDYHGTFDNYIKAKKQFFDLLPSGSWALTNKDDRNGLLMLQNSKASRYTYAMKNGADFQVKILESDFQGMLLQLGGEEMWVNLVGSFNAYNLAAVYGAAFLITGGSAENIGLLISLAKRVNGRFEAISGPDRITAIVDYAHTPDALENVIKTINQIRENSVKLITVVGCGGNRDKTKRPEMGAIAARLSNTVIFTSDNPRDEDPNQIIADMEAGVEGQHYKKMLKITDRREAIRTAATIAGKGDVILIAGKGHETYQEIAGVKHPFDDKKIIQEIFNQKA
jgi:UDP-N-acetylmuramoyl-L-alanyl-D-glutamate--2,6-diaminopimelate ligase